MFNHQKALTSELLIKLQCQPFTSKFVLNALLGEFTNFASIYQWFKQTLWMAIQLLQTEPALNKLSPTDSPWLKRSLPPFLGDALQWLTGTATMKDMTKIKWQINLLMQEQTKQQAIEDDDAETAPIYKGRGTVEQHSRPHKNHDRHMEQEATSPESHCR